MATEDLVMVIDKSHFTVKLHRNLLEVDLKKGAKKELEDAVETNPALRRSLGFLFQNIIPLDLPLKDIGSVKCDDKGHVKIKVPHRKDITIQLERDESRNLVDKLNQLVSLEKEKEIENRRVRAIMDDR